MATSYGSLCDDFYVNMTLNTELELPTARDTVLHFFECLQRKFSHMNTFYQRDTGEFCLDEDRESGCYRWVTLERDRISCGAVNPDSIEQADSLHQYVLELVPYTLSINKLDIDSLDVVFGMDFDYQGNHDEILAEALFHDSPFISLLDLPHARPLGFDPSIIVSLSEDCRMQGRLSFESRTGAYQIRTGKYKEDDQLSLYLAVRQYPNPEEEFSSVKSYYIQRSKCEDLMNDRIIPNFVQPIHGAISQRR
ncbi:MAG: hypothetical protein JW860_09620 [Sedimentisphaerales bacterium]|nr:hypothetical protein [Sedimentisphaerales bacterium]